MMDHTNKQNPNPEDEHLSPEPVPETENAAPATNAAQGDETPLYGVDPMDPQDVPADAKIAALEQDVANAKDQTLRALAEVENIRKRSQREREDARKYAVTDFARDLLSFADNFRRALESLPQDAAQMDERVKGVIEGIEAMERDVLTVFDRHGITRITPVDEPFNPNFHEVMFEAPGTGKPAGTIIQIIEPGYMLHDRLLRPARVGIAKDEGQGGPVGSVDTEA